MKELDIHKLLLSYGMLPVLSVLKELEAKEDYDKCISLRDGINSFKERFYFAFSDEKKIESEEEFYAYYENYSSKCSDIIKSNLEYYIREIKEKLEI